MLESAFNKGLVSNFIKKRLEHWFSPANIAEFLRSPVLKNICKWRIVSDIILHNLFFENSNFRTKISRKVRGKLPPPPPPKKICPPTLTLTITLIPTLTRGQFSLRQLSRHYEKNLKNCESQKYVFYSFHLYNVCVNKFCSLTNNFYIIFMMHMASISEKKNSAEVLLLHGEEMYL